MNRLHVTSVILLMLGGKSLECGERLEEGGVFCRFEEKGNIEPFEPGLCTHASVVITSIVCTKEHCWPDNSTVYEQTINTVKSYVPKNGLGLELQFNEGLSKHLTSRLQRLKTAKNFISYMETRGFGYLHISESSWEPDFINTNDRVALQFLEEIAGAIHSRGWQIGLSIRGGETDLNATYNFEKLSSFVDWYELFAVKIWTDETIIQPFIPTSSNKLGKDYIGTTKYWIELMLKKVKPECLVLFTQTVGLKYSAVNIAVETGPGAKAAPKSRKIIWVSDVCDEIEYNNCPRYWDDDASLPWSVCGGDYYSYPDAKSMKIKTELAKEYNLSGMGVQVSKNYGGGPYCLDEDSDPLVFVKSIQGIRKQKP